MRFKRDFHLLPILIIGFSVLVIAATLFFLIYLILNPEIIGEYIGRISNGFKEISQ